MKELLSIEEFLQTGLLEKYALGELTTNQKGLVEKYLERYPSLKDELGYMESSLENMARENAVSPPNLSAEQILERVRSEEKKMDINTGRINWPLYLAIGLAAGLCYSIWSQWTTQDLLEEQQKEMALFAADCEKKQNRLQSEMAFYQHEQTQQVILSKMEGGPECHTVIYWNEKANRGCLTSMNLPALTDDEDYQLWADIDGEMVSVGILKAPKNGPRELNFLKNAESLNITIEPKGGSNHPNVARLVSTEKV